MTTTTTTNQTTNFNGVTISDTLLGDSLFGGNDTTGIDVEESYDRYIEMVTEQVQSALPGIEVEIATDLRCVGYSRPASILYDGAEVRGDEDYIRDVYNGIAERVFEGGEWVVESQDQA